MDKFRFDYSENSDILHIHKNEKITKGSVEAGDFTLDLDENKDIIGLEIEHASRFFKKSDIEKKLLKKIQDIKFIVHKNKLIFLDIKFPDSAKKISVPLVVA